jgi:hypothetical protein
MCAQARTYVISSNGGKKVVYSYWPGKIDREITERQARSECNSLCIAHDMHMTVAIEAPDDNAKPRFGVNNSHPGLPVFIQKASRGDRRR